MSKVYAVIGSNSMTVVADEVRYTPATGEVLMKSERPEGDYIATEDGEWVKDTSKEIADLDSQYQAQKDSLIAEYTDALIHGDTDTQELVQTEMTELDTWYDKEYNKIVGGVEE